MPIYALCGNLYTEAVAKIYFKNRLLLIHRSNANRPLNKAFRLSIFIAAVLLRYAVCAPLKVNFSIAAPHLCNKYKLIYFMLQPHKVYLIDDGITFEYWSNFHENNIKSFLRLPSISGIIGPKIPKWPVGCANMQYAVVSRMEAVGRMLGRKFHVEDAHFQPFKNDKAVCVLDDGTIELDHLKKLSEDFKKYCNATVCHLLLHPSRDVTKRNISAEGFLLEPSNNIGAVYGKASTTLFNVISFNKNIKVYSQGVAEDDLMKSLRESGIEIAPWCVEHGFQ